MATNTRVRKVIAEALGQPADDLPDTLALANIADSLEAVDILSRLEVEFGVDLPDDEFFDAETVGDVIKVVERKLGPVQQPV